MNSLTTGCESTESEHMDLCIYFVASLSICMCQVKTTNTQMFNIIPFSSSLFNSEYQKSK